MARRPPSHARTPDLPAPDALPPTPPLQAPAAQRRHQAVAVQASARDAGWDHWRRGPLPRRAGSVGGPASACASARVGGSPSTPTPSTARARSLRSDRRHPSHRQPPDQRKSRPGDQLPGGCERREWEGHRREGGPRWDHDRRVQRAAAPKWTLTLPARPLQPGRHRAAAAVTAGLAHPGRGSVDRPRRGARPAVTANHAGRSTIRRGNAACRAAAARPPPAPAP